MRTYSLGITLGPSSMVVLSLYSRLKQCVSVTVAFSLFCLGGCATVSAAELPPVPRLQQPDSSGIAISVIVRADITGYSRVPDGVFFAKTDDGGGIRQMQVLRSNYAKEGRVYFLGLPPGNYAAVAASYFGPQARYNTYFPKELVEQTQVIVRRGEVAFMGHYVIDSSIGLTDADPIQLHYAEVIAPGAAKSGVTGQAFDLVIGSFLGRQPRIIDVQLRGSINEGKRDSETRNEFLKKAKEDLAEGGWTQLLDPTLQPIAIGGMSNVHNDEIYEAAQAGDLAKAKALLFKVLLVQNPKLANAKIEDGGPPLHLAASVGRKDIVDLLLAKGEDANSTDGAGVTPLLAAAMFGHKDVAEFLLTNGAEVNARDKAHGLTILHFVVSIGRKDMAELLLANGADINAKANNSATPLYSAALHGRKDMVELLLANGAEVNARDNVGMSPLSMASMKGFTEVATVLRRHGAKE